MSDYGDTFVDEQLADEEVPQEPEESHVLLSDEARVAQILQELLREPLSKVEFFHETQQASNPESGQMESLLGQISGSVANSFFHPDHSELVKPFVIQLFASALSTHKAGISRFLRSKSGKGECGAGLKVYSLFRRYSREFLIMGKLLEFQAQTGSTLDAIGGSTARMEVCMAMLKSRRTLVEKPSDEFWKSVNRCKTTSWLSEFKSLVPRLFVGMTTAECSNQGSKIIRAINGTASDSAKNSRHNVKDLTAEVHTKHVDMLDKHANSMNAVAAVASRVDNMKSAVDHAATTLQAGAKQFGMLEKQITDLRSEMVNLRSENASKNLEIDAKQKRIREVEGKMADMTEAMETSNAEMVQVRKTMQQHTVLFRKLKRLLAEKVGVPDFTSY